jgi:cytochrome c-type biogenesis protein CcmE
MFLVGAVLVGVVVALTLAVRAFQENLLYFFSPTQVAAGEAPDAREFRLGGMVVDDSVAREPGSLTVRFVLSDYQSTVPVSYTGVLPDLFREGQGIVARGQMNGSGTFVAAEVLAKHDENYMPPEVADALAKARATVTE